MFHITCYFFHLTCDARFLYYFFIFLRSRFSRSGRDSKESPRSGRRSEERDAGRGSPRSAARRERDKEQGRDSRNGTKLTLELNTTSSNSKEVCLAPLQELQQAKVSKVASLGPSPGRNLHSSSNNHSSSGVSSNMVQHQSSGIPQHAQTTNNSCTPGSPLAPGTGIPKPTAAVKGTAKPVPVNINNQSSITKDYPCKSVRGGGGGAQSKSKIMSNCTSTTNGSSSNCGLPEDEKFNYDGKDSKGSLPRQKQVSRPGEEPRPAVALVSPMPARELNNGPVQQNINPSNVTSSVYCSNGNGMPVVNGNQVSTSESASTLSEVSQNSGHSNNSNSSGSSVIYRPNSSEDDLDLKLASRNVSFESFFTCSCRFKFGLKISILNFKVKNS